MRPGRPAPSRWPPRPPGTGSPAPSPRPLRPTDPPRDGRHGRPPGSGDEDVEAAAVGPVPEDLPARPAPAERVDPSGHARRHLASDLAGRDVGELAVAGHARSPARSPPGGSRTLPARRPRARGRPRCGARPGPRRRPSLTAPPRSDRGSPPPSRRPGRGWRARRRTGTRSWPPSPTRVGAWPRRAPRPGSVRPGPASRRPPRRAHSSHSSTSPHRPPPRGRRYGIHSGYRWAPAGGWRTRSCRRRGSLPPSEPRTPCRTRSRTPRTQPSAAPPVGAHPPWPATARSSRAHRPAPERPMAGRPFARGRNGAHQR